MISGEKHSDYINASYVDVRATHKLASVYNMKYNYVILNVQGFKRRQLYIASQGTEFEPSTSSFDFKQYSGIRSY